VAHGNRYLERANAGRIKVNFPKLGEGLLVFPPSP